MRLPLIEDTTYRIIRSIPYNRPFSLWNVTEQVGILINRPNIYPATVARMIRKLRQDNKLNVQLFSKPKSMYVNLPLGG